VQSPVIALHVPSPSSQLVLQEAHAAVDSSAIEYVPAAQASQAAPPYPASHALHAPVVATHVPGAVSHPSAHGPHALRVPPVEKVPVAHAEQEVSP